jgi:hypothetical protein
MDLYGTPTGSPGLRVRPNMFQVGGRLMAGATYVNPYTPETPIGAGLQNIALALTGKRRTRSAALTRSRAICTTRTARSTASRHAQGARRAQLAERLLRDQGADSQDELIAATPACRSYTVRGYRDALPARRWGSTLDDYGDGAGHLARDAGGASRRTPTRRSTR